ncbi:MAG: hypothetical protein IE914_06110 [Thiotrichales bacterium]|nr:hypothetical protein [Thiotrichales bacterium]
MTRSNNQFFEVALSIYAGSNERKAFDKDALRSMGFNEIDFEAVKAMLQTAVLPKEAFYPFLAIRKAVQDYLASKGQNHDLMGRVFNPKERVEVIQFLREKKAEYEAAAKEFLANYPIYLREQIEKVENSAKLKGLDPVPLVKAVRDNQPSADYFRKKLQFRFIDKSIELDSEEWAEEINMINSDLRARTIYELSRDADAARNQENVRTRAKHLLALADRLRSLDFYVNGLGLLADKVEKAVNTYGGLKPTKDYSQRESLALSGIGIVLDNNAANLVNQKTDFDAAFNVEANRIEALLAEDEDQMVIEETEAEIQPVVSAPKLVESEPVPETEPSVEDIQEDIAAEVPIAASTMSSYGTFAF